MTPISPFEIQLRQLAARDKAVAEAFFRRSLLATLQPASFDLGNGRVRSVLAVGQTVLDIEVRECTQTPWKPATHAKAV